MSKSRRNGELEKLARTYHAAASTTDDAIFHYLHALNCPKSLAVWLLYKSGEHQQLVDMDIEPEHFNSMPEFRDAYSAWSFLSKSDFLKLEVSKKDQAFRKFFQYEELCRQTNGRFRNLSLDPNYQGSNVWLLNATTRKIAEVLGDYQPEEFVEGCDWGPGVTTLLKGEHVSAINKFHSENGITRDLYSLVGSWFPAAYPLWYNHLTLKFGEQWEDFQVGNSIVTVPKNSKTDRVIAVEPGINLWFQKSIGAMIRRRLRRRGVNLQDQSVNQRYAKLASKTGLLATVDFSSASDSIASKVVEELLPPQWYSLLCSTRSPLGKHNKTLIRWEKFSSMGNGFTFELESLIFYCAALAVREYVQLFGSLGDKKSLEEISDVSVYGDDVIIPVACYDLFTSFSAFLGFKVNKDKSFSKSYFRESCGAHYFDGVDVKPIFLKERLRSVQSIYKLANSVRWLAHRRNSHYGCDSRLRITWCYLFGRIPKPLRLGIPHGIGDSGLICNFDEATPALARHGIEGYYVSALIESGVNQNFDGPAVTLARLWGMSTQPSAVAGGARGQLTPFVIRCVTLNAQQAPLSNSGHGNSYDLRGRVRSVINRVLIQQWYNLGPWM